MCLLTVIVLTALLLHFGGNQCETTAQVVGRTGGYYHHHRHGYPGGIGIGGYGYMGITGGGGRYPVSLLLFR